MKKIFYSLAVVLFMASCSGSSDELLDDLSANRVEVKMNVGITPGTRAAIESDANGLLNKLEKLNVYFVRAADAETANWGSETTLVPAVLDNKGVITFNTPQYYNADENKLSHFYGFAPTVTPSNGKVTVGIDGDTDFLYTKTFISGNKSKKGTPLTPVFDHALTWIKVKIKADSEASANVWGKVKKVTLKGLDNQIQYTLGENGIELSYTGTKENYDMVGEEALPYEATADFLEFSEALVAPKAEYTVEVTTDNNVYELPNPVSIGNVDDSAVAGKISDIELTFSAVEITATAKITAWGEGKKGSATVE